MLFAVCCLTNRLNQDSQDDFRIAKMRGDILAILLHPDHPDSKNAKRSSSKSETRFEVPAAAGAEGWWGFGDFLVADGARQRGRLSETPTSFFKSER
jgi:hypothetical protein